MKHVRTHNNKRAFFILRINIKHVYASSELRKRNIPFNQPMEIPHRLFIL